MLSSSYSPENTHMHQSFHFFEAIIRKEQTQKLQLKSYLDCLFRIFATHI